MTPRSPASSASVPGPDPLPPADIAALATAAATKDSNALQKLFLLHHPRLASFVRRKVGVDWSGRIDPEDVVQETYASACASIGAFSYRGEDSFYRWLSQIANDRFVDKVRALKSKKRDVGREARGAGWRDDPSRYQPLVDLVADKHNHPSRAARKADAVGGILAALATLPEEYRIAVQRVYLDHATFVELAKELGKSEDAARRLTARAVEKLRVSMGNLSRWMSRVA